MNQVFVINWDRHFFWYFIIASEYFFDDRFNLGEHRKILYRLEHHQRPRLALSPQKLLLHINTRQVHPVGQMVLQFYLECGRIIKSIMYEGPVGLKTYPPA